MDRPRQFLPPSQPTVSIPDACATSSSGVPLGAEVGLGSVPWPRDLLDLEVGWGGRIRTPARRDINDRCRLLEVGQRLGRCVGCSAGWGGGCPNLSLDPGSAAGIADIGYEPTDGETEKGTLNTRLNSEIVGWLREFVITEG
jgi:hypothetical protein